jgi:3-keto-L-gulonate-6-phosphate decarboxylase
MRTQPKVLSYELLSVRSGMSGSTVEAELTTKAGKRVVFMVLNSSGKIDRYYIDRADDASSQVALQFVQAISTGNFITAQSFLESQLPKIEKLRRLIEASGRDIRLQVDGGVTAKTAPLCLNAGADVLVAGTAVFGAPDYAAAIQALRGGAA